MAPRCKGRHALGAVAILLVGARTGQAVCKIDVASSGAAWYSYLLCLQRECEDSVFSCDMIAPSQCNARLPAVVAATIGSPMQAAWDFDPATFSVCPKKCRRCGASVPPPRLPPICPGGWTYSDGRCFRYFDREDGALVTWAEARRACTDLGGGADLAALDTHLRDAAGLEVLVAGRRLNNRGWFGLRQAGPACNRSRPEAWEWVSSNMSLAGTGYTNWGAGAQGCSSSSSPACGVLWPDALLWTDAPCGDLQVGWLCSRPAAFRSLERGAGTCEDNGMETITDPELCAEAAEAMGYVPGPVLVNNATWSSEGCGMCYFPAFQFSALYVAANAATRGTGARYAGVSMLCAPAGVRRYRPDNASVDVVKVGQVAEEASRLQPGREVTIPVAGMAYGLLLAIAVAYRRVLNAFVVGALTSGRRLLPSWPRRPRGGSFAASASTLDNKAHHRASEGTLPDTTWALICGQRSRFATGVAIIFIIFDVAEVTSSAVVGSEVCDLASQTWTQTALVVLVGARVVVSAVFLLLQRRRCGGGRLHLWLFVVASFSLQGAHVAIAGEQDLLDGAREATELRWRLLVGACLQLRPMCLLQGVYSVACIAIFRWRIPDNQVVLASASRSRLLVRRGCVHLVATRDVQNTIEMLRRFEPIGQAVVGEPFTVGFSILSAIVGQTASFVTFALSELLLLALVLVCLWLLQHLLVEEAKASQRLQCTQSLLDAVSAMLDALCDAVVHVDGECKISRPAPQLAALLHKSALLHETPLWREDLLDHLIEEDRPRLRAALGADADVERKEESSGSEHIVLLTFRDAFALRVPCQVFHARFTLEDGSISYVLGINETGERGQAQPAELVDVVGQSFRHHARPRRPSRSRSWDGDDDDDGDWPGHPADRSSSSSGSASPGTPRGRARRSTSSTSGLPRGRVPDDTSDDSRTERIIQVDVRVSDGVIIASTKYARRMLGTNPKGKRLSAFLASPQLFDDWLHQQAMSQESMVGEYTVQEYGPAQLLINWSSAEAYEVTLHVQFPPRDFVSSALGGSSQPDPLPETYCVSVRMELVWPLAEQERGRESRRRRSRDRQGTAARTGSHSLLTYDESPVPTAIGHRMAL